MQRSLCKPSASQRGRMGERVTGATFATWLGKRLTQNERRGRRTSGIDHVVNHVFKTANSS